MGDLQLTIQEQRTFVDSLALWVPRIGVAILFFALGASKFAAHSGWVRVFDRIGIGQWFRVFTGGLQAGGAVLLLVPRVSWIGAAILSCTMLGAVVTQAFILHTALLAISPAVLLVITAVSARRRAAGCDRSVGVRTPLVLQSCDVRIRFRSSR